MIENCNRCIHSCVCKGEKYGRDECGEFFEIVRCEDCKKQNECGLYVDSEPEWFCADGERKETE